MIKKQNLKDLVKKNGLEGTYKSRHNGLHREGLTHEEVRQKEGSEVVCGNRQFETLISQLLRQISNCSVVDKYIDLLMISKQ